ncbi:MAG TPA: universal stress protein [Candidatus Paenibacillus intestinavium]|nr:universal stress protein [Candidatus Paenibacillus intestinavium]
MFNKILVAIDSSNMSKKALQTALLLANNQQSKVTLMHVGREFILPQGVVVTDIATVKQEMRQIGIDILNDAKKELAKQGLDVETHYTEGSAPRLIVAYATKEQFDLIVIGSRGLGNIKEMMLGSVSHKVSKLSTCPVLIVK